MLKDLLPVTHGRYTSLPLLGEMAADFEIWLQDKGYARSSRRQKISDTACIERYLWRRGIRHIDEVRKEDLGDCWRQHRHVAPYVSATARALMRFLEEKGLLCPSLPEQPTASGELIAAYTAHLKDVRGLAPTTILVHTWTVSRLLKHLGYDSDPCQIAGLCSPQIEDFVKGRGEELARGTLQHVVAHVRGFLRFLGTTGAIPPTRQIEIDTPRLYRLEQLPRAVPWKTVRALLRSIDRSTATGLRDFAMFTLIATYGLRASEVVALTLDDIHWRERWTDIHRRKNEDTLRLPLTDPVAMALLAYLRRGRPASPHREVFLRGRAPSGTLRPTAVTEALQKWSRRSGLAIPYHGPHCLRHSYAVQLLRKGTSLKTIGALLGHREAESTCVYLRMEIKDLRRVALSAPRYRDAHCAEEALS